MDCSIDTNDNLLDAFSVVMPRSGAIQGVVNLDFPGIHDYESLGIFFGMFFIPTMREDVFIDFYSRGRKWTTSQSGFDQYNQYGDKSACSRPTDTSRGDILSFQRYSLGRLL